MGNNKEEVRGDPTGRASLGKTSDCASPPPPPTESKIEVLHANNVTTDFRVHPGDDDVGEVPLLLPTVSFRQFVRFLLSSPDSVHLNKHWLPQWLSCDVCRRQFDLPGRLETLGEDAEFVFRRANASDFTLAHRNTRTTQLVVQYI